MWSRDRCDRHLDDDQALGLPLGLGLFWALEYSQVGILIQQLCDLRHVHPCVRGASRPRARSHFGANKILGYKRTPFPWMGSGTATPNTLSAPDVPCVCVQVYVCTRHKRKRQAQKDTDRTLI